MSRLENARIVAWEINNATVLAYREHPGNLFDSFNTRTGKQQVVNENQVARQKWRALEEFPNPTLAEIVGDAPAFTFTVNGLDRGPLIAVRTDTDAAKPWRVVWERGPHGQYRDLTHMENDYLLYGPGPITSVTPLRPDTKPEALS